jgi:hypothetical protein
MAIDVISSVSSSFAAEVLRRAKRMRRSMSMAVRSSVECCTCDGTDEVYPSCILAPKISLINT